MAHEHSVYDNDTHFKIDPVTRAIENTSGKVMLQQRDHNSERFTFEIPRFIDGHDMSLCNKVEVHYCNIDAATRAQNADAFPVTDLQISPDSDDVVICSWLISQNATKYAGTLNFVVRYACNGDDGKIEYQWFSGIHKGIAVGESYYNGEAIVEEYSDILAAFESRIAELEKGGGGSGNTFVAEYGKTTYAEIMAAHNEGKIVCCKYIDAIAHLCGVNNQNVEFIYHRTDMGVTTLFCSTKDVWSQNVTAMASQQDIGDALKAIDLTEPINTALAQAKESGEFKGEKGDKGDKGDKYTLTEADKTEIASMAVQLIPVYEGEVSEE